MKIGLGVQQNPFFNAHRINSGIAAKNGGTAAQSTEKSRFDNVSISSKANNPLENLMKQKLRISERKDDLIRSTLENGGTMDSIKTQLEAYDKQLKNIDEQVAGMAAEEMKKQAESSKSKHKNEPRTEEAIQNERLANITSLSNDLEQAEVMSSVKTKVDGDAHVLKSEIELDKMRAGSSAGAKELIEKKEAKLSGLEQKSIDLTSTIANKIADTAEKITDNNRPQEIAPEEEGTPGETTADNSESSVPGTAENLRDSEYPQANTAVKKEITSEP